MSNQVEKLKTNFDRYGKFYPNVLDKVKSWLPHQKINLKGGGVMYWNQALSIPTMDKKLYVREGYNKNAMVYSVVNKIAKTAAQAPLQAYKVVNEKAYQKYKSLTVPGRVMTKEVMVQTVLEKHKAFELLPDSHELNQLLLKPNKQQGQADFVENIVGIKLITGDAFIYGITIGRKGRPGEMIVLPSHDVLIKPDGNGVRMSASEYQLSFGGNIIKFKPEEVLHTKYWNPNWNIDGQHLYGFSPLHAGWLSVQQDNDARLAGIELLQNRGPRGLLGWEIPEIAGMTEKSAMEQVGRLKEEWRQLTKEYKDQLALMIGKFNYTQTGLSSADLKILETSKFSQSDICNLYGVSEKLFNSPDGDAKYSNLNEYKKDMIANVVIPELNKIRDGLNNKLITDWGYKNERIVVDFDISVFKELDEDKKELAQWMDLAGCFTENEKRIVLGFDVLEYKESANPMDRVYKKSVYVPIELLGKVDNSKNEADNAKNEQDDRKN